MATPLLTLLFSNAFYYIQPFEKRLLSFFPTLDSAVRFGVESFDLSDFTTAFFHKLATKLVFSFDFKFNNNSELVDMVRFCGLLNTSSEDLQFVLGDLKHYLS